jgi:hypothetical protein
MAVDGAMYAPPSKVTPEAGEGTLGTWRFGTGLGHRAEELPCPSKRTSIVANHGCVGRARGQPERFRPRGKAAMGKAKVRTGLGKSDRPGS